MRLYRTTRRLSCQVETALRRLGVPALVGSPTAAGLVALYVTGLILLDARPTQTRVAHALPARSHDALNRRLRTMPLSPRALMHGLPGQARTLSARRGTPGSLCVDDVGIAKAFARKRPRAAWTYSSSQERKVYGLHVVLVCWARDPRGPWRIPVACRLWRPKRPCAPNHSQKRAQLAEALLRELVAAGCPAAYLVGDTASTGGALTQTAARPGLIWVGTLAPRTTVVYHGRRQPVQRLAARRQLRWRRKLGVRATARRVYAPAVGQVQVVVLRNEHGNLEHLVTNGLGTDLTTLVVRKRSRWRLEARFRDTKQRAGLTACQGWSDAAFVRHVALVLVTCVVPQCLRCDSRETVGAVKARWQGAVLRDGQTPPAPLRATPREFRQPHPAPKPAA